MNSNHKDYLDSFKNYLFTMAKSQNTVDSYLSDLRQYFSMFQEINRGNVQKYKDKISSLAASTFNRKLSSLKQFNEYLVTQDVMDQVMVYGQDYINIQKKGNPTNISEKTVLKFLDRVRKKNCMYKCRNFTIIYLMVNTGIRRSECCNLLLENINGNKLTVRGKWNKERTVILNNKTIEVINDYLIDRKKHKYSHSPYLFVSERGNKLTKESINGIFKFYCTPTIKVTPHSLRHNWCTTVIEQGVLTPKQVQDQAGHSSIITTDLYTHARMESIENKIKDFSIG